MAASHAPRDCRMVHAASTPERVAWPRVRSRVLVGGAVKQNSAAQAPDGATGPRSDGHTHPARLEGADLQQERESTLAVPPRLLRLAVPQLLAGGAELGRVSERVEAEAVHVALRPRPHHLRVVRLQPGERPPLAPLQPPRRRVGAGLHSRHVVAHLRQRLRLLVAEAAALKQRRRVCLRILSAWVTRPA